MCDLSKIKWEIPAPTPGRRPEVIERKRINADPKLSLYIYGQLKKKDVFGFGVTRPELARALLAYSINPRATIVALH